jgi:hypothetical protein
MAEFASKIAHFASPLQFPVRVPSGHRLSAATNGGSNKHKIRPSSTAMKQHRHTRICSNIKCLCLANPVPKHVKILVKKINE